MNSNINRIFFDKAIKKYENFLKIINNRFEYFSDFCIENYDNSSILLNNYCNNIFSKYSEIINNFNNIPKENLFHYWKNFGNVLCHFYYVSINFILKQLPYSFIYNHYNTENKIINENKDNKLTLINFDTIFKLLKMLDFRETFCEYIKDDNLNFFIEMTYIYFLNYLRDCFLESLDYKNINISNEIMTNDEIFDYLISNKVFDSIEGFINFYYNRLLKNLRIKNKILLIYSLNSIKGLFNKLRSLKKFKGNYNPIYLNLRDNFFQFFLNLDIINDAEFFNIRKNIMVIISYNFLNDTDEDYINNSKFIINSIIKLSIDTSNNDKLIMSMKIFKDFQGIIQNIILGNIFFAFMRIVYPKINLILNNSNSDFLDNQNFVISLIDLYISIIENGSKNIKIKSIMNIFLNVIFDSSKILNNVIMKIFNLINENKIKDYEFFEKNIKITKKILYLFKTILDFKDGSFSIIVFFKDNDYSNWMQYGFNFILLFSKFIKFYPNEKNWFLSLLLTLLTTSFDYIFENLSIENIINIFEIVFELLNQHIKDKIENKDWRILTEDDFIKDFETIISTIGEYLINEKLIMLNKKDQLEKISQIINSSKNVIFKLIKLIIETCLILKIYNLIFEYLSKSIFILICLLDKNDIKFLFLNIFQELNINDKKPEDLLFLLFKNVEIKYNDTFIKEFKSDFKIFIKNYLKNKFLEDDIDFDKSFFSNNDNQINLMKEANNLSNNRRKLYSHD